MLAPIRPSPIIPSCIVVFAFILESFYVHVSQPCLDLEMWWSVPRTPR